MIATKTVEFKSFMDYYPYGKNDDKSQILRNIALALAEVVGKWDIFYENFTDRAQCGVSEYTFGELDKGFFIQDVLSVKLGSHCIHEGACGTQGWSYDDSDCVLTINPPPEQDCVLTVKAKLGIDLNNICSIPQSFFRKYAVHIANYAVYKQEVLRRGEKKQASHAQVQLLYRDAVEFFITNEYHPFLGQVVELEPQRINFQPC